MTEKTRRPFFSFLLEEQCRRNSALLLSFHLSLSLSHSICRCVFKRVKPVMARATGQRKMLCTIKMWRVGWLVSSSFFFPRSRLDRMETLRRPRRGGPTHLATFAQPQNRNNGHSLLWKETFFPERRRRSFNKRSNDLIGSPFSWLLFPFSWMGLIFVFSSTLLSNQMIIVAITCPSQR